MKELYIKLLSCLFARIGNELERVTRVPFNSKQVQPEAEKKESYWQIISKKNLN